MAGAEVDGSPDRCLALLADVETYSSWCPDVVRRAVVVRRDRATRAAHVQVTLRLGIGPLAGSFEELMEQRIDPPDQVSLTRVPHTPDDPERLDLTWRIEAGPPTRLTVELSAVLDIPRLVPLGGAAESVAHELLAAAVRALSPSSSMTSASSS